MDESGINEFRIIDKLGEGSFADVYKVKSINNQKIYAEKRLKKRYRSLEEVRNLTEVSALKLLSRHPNIITLHSIMYDSQTGHVALIFEQMEMNLYEFISKRKQSDSIQFDEFTASLLMYQLTKAISYVHSCGIFHRDIKPENCLVNSSTLELKLADFGSVSPIANRTRFTEYIATRWYRAPECILTTGAYGPPVDIWAIGCVFYEMLTMRPLFPGKHQLDQLNKIHNILGTPSRDYLARFQPQIGSPAKKETDSSPMPAKIDLRFAFPTQKQQQPFEALLPNTSKDIVDLIKVMITYDPADRITANDALKHPAFRYLYQLDIEWQKSSRTTPFSVYAIQCHERGALSQTAPVGISPSPSAPLPNSYENNIKFDQNTSQKVNKNTSSGHISFEIPDKAPNALIQIKPINNVQKQHVSNAQRAVEFQKRQILAKQKMYPNQKTFNKPLIMPQKGNLGATLGLSTANKTTKPINGAQQSIFQKPRPEMVQPRLPPISYKPLKRP